MTKQILRTVLAGILAGALLFIMPFFMIRVLLFIVLILTIIRLLGGGRRRFRGGMYPGFAAKYQQMTEEEKAAFRAQWPGRYGRQPEPEPKA